MTQRGYWTEVIYRGPDKDCDSVGDKAGRGQERMSSSESVSISGGDGSGGGGS